MGKSTNNYVMKTEVKLVAIGCSDWHLIFY